MNRDWTTGLALTFQPVFKRSDGFAQIQAERVRSKVKKRRASKFDLNEEPIRKCASCSVRLRNHNPRQKKFCSQRCQRSSMGRLNGDDQSKAAIYQALRFHFGMGCAEIGRLLGVSKDVVYNATEGDLSIRPWHSRNQGPIIEEARRVIVSGCVPSPPSSS